MGNSVPKSAISDVSNLILDDQALENRRVRRVPLGDNLVFLFDSEIADEPVAVAKKSLTCTLLVVDNVLDVSSRWMDISRHIYVRCPSNLIIRANQISAGVLNGTTSPVQRLIFDTEGHVPVSIGCDDPEFVLEVYFPFEVLRALSDDLGGDAPPLVDLAF